LGSSIPPLASLEPRHFQLTCGPGPRARVLGASPNARGWKWRHRSARSSHRCGVAAPSLVDEHPANAPTGRATFTRSSAVIGSLARAKASRLSGLGRRDRRVVLEAREKSSWRFCRKAESRTRKWTKAAADGLVTTCRPFVHPGSREIESRLRAAAISVTKQRSISADKCRDVWRLCEFLPRSGLAERDFPKSRPQVMPVNDEKACSNGTLVVGSLTIRMPCHDALGL
jgi:hypothetical protein